MASFMISSRCKIPTQLPRRFEIDLLFYDAPTWVFTAAYVAFAALVAITWVAVPPTRTPRKQ